MYSMEQLKRIEMLLKNEQYATDVLEVTEESMHPCLLVYLGKDSDKRDRILRIYVQEQAISEALLPDDKEPKTTIVTLVFELEFPFEFDPYHTPQLGSLLHFINNQQKMTAFSMDEVHNKIYLRYHMMTAAEGINTQVLLAILGILMFLYDLHYKSIEEVAAGHLTFDEIAQQIINEFNKLPPME